MSCNQGTDSKQQQEVGSRQCFFNEQGEDGHQRCNCMDGSSIGFPPGYRFQPLDEELLLYYLKKKVDGDGIPFPDFMSHKIREVELYAHSPENLIVNYKLDYGEKDWYFFTPRDKKYPNGTRPNRAAGDGYWKATGADKKIYIEGNVIGCRKALVYYKGKSPQGEKTNWIMHEFTVAPSPNKSKVKNIIGNNSMRLNQWVLCKIYKKVDKVQKEDGQQVQQLLVENELRTSVSAATNVNPLPSEPQRFPSIQPDPVYINQSRGGNLEDVVFRNQPLPIPRFNDNFVDSNTFEYTTPATFDQYMGYNQLYLESRLGSDDNPFQRMLKMDVMSNICPQNDAFNIASTYPLKSGFANKMHGDNQSMDSFRENEFIQRVLTKGNDPHVSFDSPPKPYPTNESQPSPSS